jgi:signal transduction histidine kinase
MGRLLVGAGLFVLVLLLDRSSEGPLGTVGLLAAGFLPAMLAYLMLAFPSGKVASRAEQLFLLTSGGVPALAWIAHVALEQPTMCVLGQRCRSGLDSATDGLTGGRVALAAVFLGCWLVLAVGTAVILVLRARRANAHFRRRLLPMVSVAIIHAVCLCGFLGASVAGSGAAPGLENLCVASSLAVPLAIVLGLVMERLSLGRMLARFVAALGSVPAEELQSTLAVALNDPALRIYYRRGALDRSGEAVRKRLPQVAGEDRRLAVVESDPDAVAIIDYDASLGDQVDFIRAVAKSAVIWLAREELTGELAASKRRLEASRGRLSKMADEERQRIQRDLHDGAQQHLIAMHLKLEMALEAIEEPSRCANLLAEIGQEMGRTSDDLRSLASGIFPPVLREFGLVRALRSAAERMDLDVTIDGAALARHAPAIETAIYFFCVEALQNVSKHCRPGVHASVRLWEGKRVLLAEINDSGEGFDFGAVASGSGLQNMHARLEAVGGRVSVHSSKQGTVVRAAVPLRGAPAQALVPRATRHQPVELGPRVA